MRHFNLLKVFGNNVVLVEYENTRYILIGKGIGFGKRVGELIKENETIEQSFISMESLTQNEQDQLFNRIDSELFDITQQIISYANDTLGEKLNPFTYIGLIDHIDYTIKRIKEGIEIVNPFLYETRIIYPKEYKIAEKAVLFLSKHYRLELPEAEIGFIALHINGGLCSNSKKEALEHTQLIKNICEYTEARLGINLKHNEFAQTRFIIHISGMIERIRTKSTIQLNLLVPLEEEFRFELSVATAIVRMIEHAIHLVVPSNELKFIALHLIRLKNMKNESEQHEIESES